MDIGGDATYGSGFRGWALLFFLPAQRDDDRQGYLLFIFMMQHSCVRIITFNHIKTVTIYWFWKQGRLGREMEYLSVIFSCPALS